MSTNHVISQAVFTSCTVVIESLLQKQYSLIKRSHGVVMVGYVGRDISQRVGVSSVSYRMYIARPWHTVEASRLVTRSIYDPLSRH